MLLMLESANSNQMMFGSDGCIKNVFFMVFLSVLFTTRCFFKIVLFPQILYVLYFSSAFLCDLCTANNQILAKPRRNYQTAFRSVVSVEISGKQVLGSPPCFSVSSVV